MGGGYQSHDRMLNFSIKLATQHGEFFTNHVSHKKESVHRQFYVLDQKNIVKRTTLQIQPQKHIGKYSKHFSLKIKVVTHTGNWEVLSMSTSLLVNV